MSATDSNDGVASGQTQAAAKPPTSPKPPKAPKRYAAQPVSNQLLNDIRRWIHEQSFALWVTFGFIMINVCWWAWYNIEHHKMPRHALTTSLHEFNVGHLIASLFLTGSVFQMIVDALLILLVLCLAEPYLGKSRTAAISLVSAASGTLVGLIICSAISAMLGERAEVLNISFTLSPVVLVIGALMAATAFSYQLWRRRIRIIGYTAIMVVVLYGGNPGDYCVLFAAIIGQIIGRAIAGKPIEAEQWHWQYSSSQEIRRIFGAIGVVLALGPMVATSSRSHAGPLVSVALVLSPESVNTGVLVACMHGHVVDGCLQQYSLMRASQPGDVVRSVLPLLVMLALAWGMWLGRRTAAISSIVFYAASAFFAISYYLLPYSLDDQLHITMGNIPRMILVNALIPLIYAIAVIIELPHFSIRTKPRTLRRCVAAIVIAFVVCSAIYLLFACLRPQDFTPHPNVGMVLREWPARFLPIGYLTDSSISFIAVTPLASLVLQGVGIVFWIVLVVVSFAWLNASIDYDHKAHALAEELVEDGGESMSFMTTWEGNEYWLSPSKRSAVAYRVLNHIALTTTGPFGDPDEWMSDMDEFARYCSDHSWSPVFYAIHEEAKDHLQQLGWHSIVVGDEMLIDPQSWKTTGKKWQDIRTAINKAKREGIVDEMSTYDEAPHEVQVQIEEISEQWSEGKALPEMKFTLGGVEELKDPRVQVLYAIDSDGIVQAVTSWLPTFNNGRVIGWTLDFMRYRSGSYNGIMEFLIARMAQRMHDQGVADPSNQVQFVSLSAAPLTGLKNFTDAKSDDSSNVDGTTMLQHSLALVADLLEPAYGFKSLYNFKKKFQPIERPVYISYSDSALLANLGIAIIRAYLPALTFRDALGMLSSFKPAKPKDDGKATGHGQPAGSPRDAAHESEVHDAKGGKPVDDQAGEPR